MFSKIELPIINKDITEKSERFLAEPRYEEVTAGLDAWRFKDDAHCDAANILLVDIGIVRNALWGQLWSSSAERTELLNAAERWLGTSYSISRFDAMNESCQECPLETRAEIFGIGNLFFQSYRELLEGRESAAVRTFFLGIEATAAFLDAKLPNWKQLGAALKRGGLNAFRMADEAMQQIPK